MIEKWDRRFLDLAKLVASWSKDPSTQTGAVIVRPDRTVVSLGYNGFPRGTSDDPALYADRPTKLDRVVHCEVNAILTAKEPLAGYTLYTYPFLSCIRCATVVIQVGLKRVVAPRPTPEQESRWDFQKSRDLFKEVGIIIDETSL